MRLFDRISRRLHEWLFRDEIEAMNTFSALIASNSERMPCPYNEFSEHCTGDMPSGDVALHYVLNPHKSDFPDAARRQGEWWSGRP